MNIFQRRYGRNVVRPKIRFIIYKIVRIIKYENKTGIAAVAGCAMLLLSPQTSVEAARKGMELLWMTVAPSLLPFFIFTDMLMSAGIHRAIGRALRYPVSFLLGVPGEAAFVFVSSILSGYPSGARLTAELRRSGIITRDESRDMLNFCSTSGPLFIVGAVGTGMLGSPRAGYMILASHCAGALLTGIVMNQHSFLNRSLAGRKYHAEPSDYVLQDIKICKNDTPAVMQAASEAVLHSLKTIALIGGFIIIFTVITEYTVKAGNAISYIISDCTPGVPEYSRRQITGFIDHITTAVSGLLEITVGCSHVSNMEGVGLDIKTTVCTFLVSFGGLSVMAQTAGVLHGTDIKMSDYMRAKLMHGLISAAIVVFLIILF